MINRDELIKIGQFNRPHGIHGEIGFTFTNDVFDRTECPYLVCNIDGIFVPFFIEEYRFRTDTTALMKLDGIDSDQAARMFINLEVFFPKSFLDEEPDNVSAKDFFLNYLVIDEVHGELGRIREVDDSTMNVLFIIDHNGEELLIPANDDFVISIDEEIKVIRMNIPDGLLDL